MNMKETDDILQIVMGNLKGNHKNDVLSKLITDEEAREEYRKIKNVWALASSTKKMSEDQVEGLYLNFKKQLAIRQKSFRMISYSFLKYAAILIIALSIGAAGFWSFYQNQKAYVYTTIADTGKNSK